MRRPPNFHSYEHGGVAAPHSLLTSPALALLPLIRFPLGYETVHPARAIVRGILLLCLFPAFWFLRGMLTGAPPPDNEGRECIAYYAAMLFAVTLLRFLRRAIGQHTGEEIHTAEAGYSIVAWLLPLPASLTEQFIVPALLGYLGWQVMHGVSFDLGCWLVICAASYLLVANWEQRNRMAQRRAPIDDKIRAQAFAGNIDRHEKRAAKPTQRRAHGKPSPLYGTGDEPDIAEAGGGRRSRG